MGQRDRMYPRSRSRRTECSNVAGAEGQKVEGEVGGPTIVGACTTGSFTSTFARIQDELRQRFTRNKFYQLNEYKLYAFKNVLRNKYIRTKLAFTKNSILW